MVLVISVLFQVIIINILLVEITWLVNAGDYLIIRMENGPAVPAPLFG